MPFSHDLSETFADNVHRLPRDAQKQIPRWSEISKHLRKDRELAFYGSEDVTPSTFYTRSDAEQAKSMAEEIINTASRWIV